MKNFNFHFEAGFGYPKYLAHLTIGFGNRTLWFNIVTSNWKSIDLRRKESHFKPFAACFSVFTVAYTD